MEANPPAATPLVSESDDASAPPTPPAAAAPSFFAKPQTPIAPPVKVALSVPPSTLALDLSTLLSSPASADVALLCGGERFPAHAALLSARSPKFSALVDEAKGARDDVLMVSSPKCPRPPRSGTDALTIELPSSFESSTLSALLRYIYTDAYEVGESSPEGVAALMAAAVWADIPRLRLLCETTLLDGLRVETVARTLLLSESLGAVTLRAAALRFLVAHAAEVTSTPGWEALAASQQPALLETMAASLANEQAASARLREEGGIVAAFTMLAGALFGFLVKGILSTGAHPVSCHNCGFVAGLI